MFRKYLHAPSTQSSSVFRAPGAALVLAANEAYHRVEASMYDEAHPEILWCEREHWIAFAKQYLSPAGSGRSIVDVGAGTGFVGQTIAPFLSPQDRYIATDLSQEMLNVLTAKLAASNARLETYVCSATDLPFPDSAIDIVTVSSAMHHFPDPDQALSEFSRILKPGGILVVMHEPNIAFARSWLLRKMAGLFSRIASKIDAKNSDKAPVSQTPIFEEVNRELLRRNLIDHELTKAEIQALVDVQSPTARGRFEPIGFAPREWTERGPLAGWRIQQFETYNYLGKLDPSARPWRRFVEKLLSKLVPHHGSLFSIVTQKPFST